MNAESALFSPVYGFLFIGLYLIYFQLLQLFIYQSIQLVLDFTAVIFVFAIVLLLKYLELKNIKNSSDDYVSLRPVFFYKPCNCCFYLKLWAAVFLMLLAFSYYSANFSLCGVIPGVCACNGCLATVAQSALTPPPHAAHAWRSFLRPLLTLLPVSPLTFPLKLNTLFLPSQRFSILLFWTLKSAIILDFK